MLNDNIRQLTITIPASLIEKPILPIELILLGLIDLHHQAKSRATIPQLATELGYSHVYVQKLIISLKARGYLYADSSPQQKRQFLVNWMAGNSVVPEHIQKRAEVKGLSTPCGKPVENLR